MASDILIVIYSLHWQAIISSLGGLWTLLVKERIIVNRRQ
ncbi:hypothetical protein CCACVL1_14719 [Corchorus capsularis]|uniref:Uncharacterized protein n=1 Tax=Corchorus capsularis TaxID=210143 RepID=A0A1R3I5V8_COCAP|nr:hypothetical protein CCACVL1_14719 [Corchorus capsularis]